PGLDAGCIHLLPEGDAEPLVGYGDHSHMSFRSHSMPRSSVGYVDSWTQRYRGMDLGPYSLLLARLMVRRRAVHLGAGVVAAVLVLGVTQFLLGASGLVWSLLLTGLVVLAAGITLFVQRRGDERIAAAQHEHVERHEPVDVAAVLGRRTRALLTVSYVGAALL